MKSAGAAKPAPWSCRRRALPLGGGRARRSNKAARGSKLQRRQRFLAGNDGDSRLARCDEFWVIVGGGSGHNHGAGTVHMGDVRSNVGHSPRTLKIAKRGGIDVATSDRHPPSPSSQSERTHPRPANTDEVDGPEIGGVEEGSHETRRIISRASNRALAPEFRRAKDRPVAVPVARALPKGDGPVDEHDIDADGVLKWCLVCSTVGHHRRVKDN